MLLAFIALTGVIAIADQQARAWSLSAFIFLALVAYFLVN